VSAVAPGKRLVVIGGRPLRGRLRVQGSKNAALPLLAACLLADGPCRLLGAPAVGDVDAMVAILEHLGARVRRSAGPSGVELEVDPRTVAGYEVPEGLMRRLRASFFVAGPLLARFGRAEVALPGGCDLGPRPVDYHLRALEALGARVRVEGGRIRAEAARLVGAEVFLDQPSVGATEHAMLAGVGAEGTTVIRNAAREPEVVDLQAFLVALGARVRGAGTSVVTVEGPAPMGSAAHEVIPDRIAAGTWLLAAAVAGGEVELEGAVPEHLGALRAKLRDAGFAPEAAGGTLRLRAAGRARATHLQTQPYPGFPTDLQNPFLALLVTADGTSLVTETVFDHRFRVVEGLLRMGADVRVYGRVAVVRGVPRLCGAAVAAPQDLRGAAALALAGLAAEGATVVHAAECLDRGYEDFAGTLAALGAEVRVEEEEPLAAGLRDAGGPPGP